MEKRTRKVVFIPRTIGKIREIATYPKSNSVFATIHPKSNGVLDKYIYYPIVFKNVLYLRNKI